MPRRYQRGRINSFEDDLVRREEERKERFLESLSAELSKLPPKAATPPALQLPSSTNPPSSGGLPDHDHSRSGQGGSILGDPTKLVTGRGKWQWDISGKVGINVFPDVRLHVRGPGASLSYMRPTGGGSGGAGPDWTPSTGSSLSDCLGGKAGTPDATMTDITSSAGDSDWIISSTSSSSAGSIDLTTLPDPGTDNGWVFKYRYQKTLALSGNVTWTLKQGTTVIESWTDTPDPGNTLAVIPVTHAFNPTNIANIVFPLVTVLHLEMSPGGGASQQAKLFVWWIEVPGTGGGTEDIVKIEGAIAQDKDWLQLLLNAGNHWGLRLPAGLANHSWVLPAAQGAAGTLLQNDGAGNLSWAGGISSHRLLDGAVNNDTVNQAATKGGLIVGKTSPSALWDQLAVGTNGQVLTADSAQTLGVKWATPAPTNNALLDGSAHNDTVAQVVSRGSLIYGNSTPKWDELVIGGNKTVLGSDGTDAAWRSLDNTYLPDRLRHIWLGAEQFLQSNGTSSTLQAFVTSTYPKAMVMYPMVDAPASSPQGFTTSFVIPQDYVSGTAIQVFLHWSELNANLIDRTWVFRYHYIVRGDKEDNDGTWTTTSDTLVDNGATGSGGDYDVGAPHYHASTQIATDIPSTGLAAGKWVSFTVDRLSTDASDNLTVTVMFLGVELRYTADM